MKKIEQLTPEQEVKKQEYYNKFLKIGLGTNQNPDKKATQKAISKFYTFLKKPKPKFIWVDSPKAALDILNDNGVKEKQYLWGSQEAYWLAYYLFCRDVLGVKYDKKESLFLNYYQTIAENAGWWFPYEKICLISKLPTIVRVNDRKQLHSFDLPALEYSDGFKVYVMHNVVVEEKFVTTPADKIDVKEVLAESNVEKRLVLLQKIGLHRVMKDLNVKVIDTCSLSKDKNNDLCEYEVNNIPIRFIVARWHDKFSSKETTLNVPRNKEDFNPKWQTKYGKDWSGNPNSASDVTMWLFGIPPGTPIHQHT